MYNHSPLKFTKTEPVRRVKDLNIKLLNLFDAFDEQQILIKSIHKGTPDLSQPSTQKHSASLTKTSKQLSTPNLSKLRQFSSREVFEKIPDLKNHEIISMTTKFHAYRHNHKNVTIETEPIEEKRKTTEPKSVRILSAKKDKNTPIAIDTNEPSYQPSATIKPGSRGQARSMPKTVQHHTLTNFNFSTPEKVTKDKGYESVRRGNSPFKEEKSAEKLTYYPERETVSAYQTHRNNKSSSSEVTGPWKFNGVRKIDLSEHIRVGSIATAPTARERSTSRKRGNSSTELLKQEDPSALRMNTRSPLLSTRSHFRIKKIEGEGVLKPPKVTVVQKQRLNDFLHNEFVDEVITNKHNARNIYDGEAFSNLNELKKVLTSHADVRAAMYVKEIKAEAAESTQRPNSKNPMIKVEDKFPQDVPRLKRFELSDPDDVVLGIRPKNLISAIGEKGQTSRRTNKGESVISVTSSSDEMLRTSEVEGKARNNFQPLKDAIDIQRERGRKIRKALKEKLLKYARLNITLADLKNIHEIFPSKPYEKKGSFAFMRVVKSGDFYAVQDYLQQNKYFVFEYDPIKQTALHWCAKRNHTRICSLLLEYGADTDAIDMGGKTPLYHALKEKNPEIVGRLLFSKANPWSGNNIDYKAICDDGWSLKYLNKARQLAILLMFHLAKDRQALWEKEAKLLIAPIDTPLDDKDERERERERKK